MTGSPSQTLAVAGASVGRHGQPVVSVIGGTRVGETATIRRCAARTKASGGDADSGRALILDYGCGACHEIPGIAEAKGRVGPSLHGLADRAYIGGVLPNMPGGLVRWIVDPTTHAPLTAMPDLGVTPDEARDIAAYLYLVGER